eukprot:TRINITY_DN3283_c0_g1_i1.p1 TRINITY_DN3283_c0_g1~~TRINITY_DN3283_c0_g1_i1.p1  ORF type:complete len:738 (+),score=131.22 TRINITY_DN3283_c0_g1_i1:4-2217(+)
MARYRPSPPPSSWQQPDRWFEQPRFPAGPRPATLPPPERPPAPQAAQQRIPAPQPNPPDNAEPQSRHSLPHVSRHRKHTLDRIGNYQLYKVIGEGSYAIVRSAVHLPSGMRVAMKIFDKLDLDPKEDELGKITAEIAALRKAENSNVIALYEVLESEEYIYLALEYAGGGELFDYIVSQSRLQEHEARHFFCQLVDAMDYLHRNSIVHRDLKPENILLDKAKNLKVIDFGMSAIVEPTTMFHEVCGSLAYASPEMLSGLPYRGFEVDVWSMGVILFAMLAGTLPFEDPDQHRLTQKIRRGKFQLPYTIPTEARDLIKRILVVDIATRATLDEIRQHPWMQWHTYIPLGPLPDARLPQIDETALSQVLATGLGSETEIRKSISTKACDQLSATYRFFVIRNYSNPVVALPSVTLVPRAVPAPQPSQEVSYWAAAQARKQKIERTQEEGRASSASVEAAALRESPRLVETPENALELPSISAMARQLTPTSAALAAAVQLRPARKPTEPEPSAAQPKPNTTQSESRTPSPTTTTAAAVDESQKEELITPPFVQVQRPRRRTRTLSEWRLGLIKMITPVNNAETAERYRQHVAPAPLTLATPPRPRATSTGVDKQSPDRRRSAGAAAAAAAPPSPSPSGANQSEEAELRLPSQWSASTTTSKAPRVILARVSKTLLENDIGFVFESPALLKCTKSDILFHIEIKELTVPKKLSVVIVRRTAGETWVYKDLCNKLFLALKS